MKISEILHSAADDFLAHDYASWGDKSRFSCDAVKRALKGAGIDGPRWDIFYGLEEMGCPTDSIYAFEYLGYRNEGVSEEVQSARYMWLKFAALMAEEQGV